MAPEALYRAADLHVAYQLRYGWTGWPSRGSLPSAAIATVLPHIAPEWERDGIRVLEHSLTAERVQLTLSTPPQVAPVTLAARIKGRLQHHCRANGTPVHFSRKLAVRAIGDPSRSEIEGYIRNQVPNEDLADERFREMLTAYSGADPNVDLSQPIESNSGRYWYNLHLVLVTSARYRIGDAVILEKIRDTMLRVCAKKSYAASTWAVLPDHLHVALRGNIMESPEQVALALLNNLAHVLDRRPWWQSGYYAGTFGEYGMAAVRGR